MFTLSLPCIRTSTAGGSKSKLGFAFEALHQQASRSTSPGNAWHSPFPRPKQILAWPSSLVPLSFCTAIAPTISAILDKPDLHRSETKPRSKSYGNTPTNWVASTQLQVLHGGWGHGVLVNVQQQALQGTWVCIYVYIHRSVINTHK